LGRASPGTEGPSFRACFENISGGLAGSEQIIGLHRKAVLGRGGWLRCSSVADFSRICALVKSEQIRTARLRGLPRHPPRRARNPIPSYFQNTLSDSFKETEIPRRPAKGLEAFLNFFQETEVNHGGT
jgi:hypothetical protein